MYWPHIWWLYQAVTRGVDCNERGLYAALIIHCVDCMRSRIVANVLYVYPIQTIIAVTLY
jgi:hypothetical protein